jgi:methionyl aminopeptidase
MINIKTKEDIEIMRKGGKILASIIEELVVATKPGIMTKDLDKLAEELVLKNKVKPSFKGYDGYPSTLCASINDEIVHGVPSSKMLKVGDLFKIDMGVVYEGFHSDSAVTVIVGGSDLDLTKQKLLDVTKESLSIGISKAIVGNTTGDIGASVQEYVEDKGLNVVIDLVGHGVGRELHEPPQIPNYGKPGTGAKLKEGMVIAIEPMVVTGEGRYRVDKDGYTFKTRDGGLAAHFEHTVAITKYGPQILTIL